MCVTAKVRLIGRLTLTPAGPYDGAGLLAWLATGHIKSRTKWDVFSCWGTSKVSCFDLTSDIGNLDLTLSVGIPHVVGQNSCQTI